MVHGQKWTADLVAEQLLLAFADLPSTYIYSARADHLDPGEIVQGGRLITACQSALGPGSILSVAVLTWARAKAAESGGSVRAYCREAFVSRSTLYERRDRALRKTATWLNTRPDLANWTTDMLPSAPVIQKEQRAARVGSQGTPPPKTNGHAAAAADARKTRSNRLIRSARRIRNAAGGAAQSPSDRYGGGIGPMGSDG